MDRNVNWSMEILANTPFELSRAHYYVDIAHRSSLLYAAATLILAVLSYFTILNEDIALWCVLANILFLFLNFSLYHPRIFAGYDQSV